ncbi:MAG: TetR/AcrR family transcriptional regulator [Pseudomonadota bacterium]|uniref:TetR/AcrR family transcriptional regulator n=1 Tax=Phenylobacterium sp. TaxID=1871053 RepID=UPI002723C4CD|nr:TetR/AcrR family transcriptional regulator [Phenylobacterium sp.]MDO9433246.1 TetR/AcrR family transcriptional regulator [Phenylobacterium sp.]
MTVSLDTELFAPPVDGRRARTAASRARILEAMIDLLQAGETQPSAEAVAAKAGVGVRTVFRLFSDVEGLYRGLQRTMAERLAPILAEPVTGSLTERLDLLVGRRAQLFEEMARPKAFADMHRARSSDLQETHRLFIVAQRALLLGHLEGLLPDDADLAEALDLMLSFDAWRRLRDDQGLSRETAERVMRRMAQALIASIPKP